MWKLLAKSEVDGDDLGGEAGEVAGGLDGAAPGPQDGTDGGGLHRVEGEQPGGDGSSGATMYDALKAALAPGETKAPEGETKPPVGQTKPPASETKPPQAETKPGDKGKYEIPTDLSPRGQQRFKELVSELRTKDEAVTQLQERVKVADGFLEAAKGVGAGPQEMGQFFEFMGHLTGGRPQDAIKFLEGQISLIAKEFGLAACWN